MRIGIGYDLHRLVKMRKLVLGGIVIPNEMGLKGHSDADVLLHAVSDALLGAIGAKDIGMLFPDSSEKNRGLDSRKILFKAYSIVKSKGYKIGNIDCVVIADSPKLIPFYDRIRKNIAALLKISVSAVGIKAKTTEGTAGIPCIKVYAVALLEKKNNAAA